MDEIIPPRLSHTDISKVTSTFLSKYNPKDIIPVPIDDIIEISLQIQIISIPNLKSVFEIDGFINSDFNQITIDDEVFVNCEERARFTLAHELGHKILHEKYYKHSKFNSIEEYVNFQHNIASSTHSILERQANDFAGCLLVPVDRLKKELHSIIEKQKKSIAPFLPPLESLPDIFKVSPFVIAIQLEKENIQLKDFL